MGDKWSGGVMAANPREGFRSETLARFALSAFGPATDIEVEDDQGIDLFCATSRRVGQRLHVGPGYLVQVKSEGQGDVPWKGDHIRPWLEGLGSPILVSVVNKATTGIRLYSTWNINRVLLNLTAYGGADPTALRLVMDAPMSAAESPHDGVPLGPPIVQFTLPQLEDKSFVDRVRDCIEEWVAMDSRNIVRRKLGLAMARGYIKWETNRPPSEFAEWYQPYYYSPATATQARTIVADCASLLALKKDPDERELLATYVKKYCDVSVLEPMVREWLGV